MPSAKRNGSGSKRGRAPVSADTEVKRPAPTRDTVSTGHSAKSACAPVGSATVILDGNTDTRGIVPGDERERLSATFGKILRTARESSGLTVPQLGRLAGVGERHLRYLEAGERRPSVDAIKAISRVLVPSTHRERLETILADAAGQSLREGNQRKKRRAENAKRKAAAQELIVSHRKSKSLISRYEQIGRPVPEVLRALVASPAIASARESAKEVREPGIPLSSAAEDLERMRDPIGYTKNRIAQVIRETK